MERIVERIEARGPSAPWRQRSAHRARPRTWREGSREGKTNDGSNQDAVRKGHGVVKTNQRSVRSREVCIHVCSKSHEKGACR